MGKAQCFFFANPQTTAREQLGNVEFMDSNKNVPAGRFSAKLF